MFFNSIYGLTLDTAIEPKNTELKSSQASNALMRGVEVCQCPEYYAGNSCEVSNLNNSVILVNHAHHVDLYSNEVSIFFQRCISGYRRVNNQLFNGHCEKCNCEGHSYECDPFTGDCINCQVSNIAI